MGRINTYILKQLLKMFGFFALGIGVDLLDQPRGEPV